MIEFYKNLAKSFAVLVVATLVAEALCLFMFFGSDELLPAHESPFPWRIETLKDQLTDNVSSARALAMPKIARCLASGGITTGASSSTLRRMLLVQMLLVKVPSAFCSK